MLRLQVKPLSFVQTLKSSQKPSGPSIFDQHFKSLPKQCLKGEVLPIKISEDEYRDGIEHRRLILSKGDNPYQTKDLWSRISSFWHLADNWSMDSLGKGFFEFHFSSMADLTCILAQGSFNLNPGVLCLLAWTPDFDPFSSKQTTAQCWVRLHGLSREY